MSFPEPKKSRSSAALSTTIKSILTIGLIYWLIQSGSIRIEYLVVQLKHIPTLILACLFLLAALSLSALRFKELLQGVKTPIGFLKCIKITAIMYFFSQCVLGPASGDFARYFYTVKETHEGTRSGAAILADRIIGTMGLIGLAGLGLLLNWSLVEKSTDLRAIAIPILGLLCALWLSLFSGIFSLIKGRSFALLASLPIFLISIFLCNSSETPFITDQIGPVLLGSSICSIVAAIIAPEFLENGYVFKILMRSSKVGEIIGQLISSLLIFRNCPLVLVRTILITAAQHMLFIVSLFIFSQIQNLPTIPSFGEVFFAAPFAFLAGIIPAPAAGLGVNEAAFETLLSLVSNGKVSAGASIYLMMRLWMTLFSLSGIPFLLREKRKKVASKEIV